MIDVILYISMICVAISLTYSVIMLIKTFFKKDGSRSFIYMLISLIHVVVLVIIILFTTGVLEIDSMATMPIM